MSDSTLKSSHASFKDQAQSYDLRVGLSPECCCAIAEKIVAIADLKPGDLIVEIGAGTGMIGQWLIASPYQYLGFDLSSEMLDIFRQKLPVQPDNCRLLQADGNDPWPVANGTAKVIFSSRTIHLLNEEHIIKESFRVAHREGAVLLLGSIQRDREGMKAKMRQEMQRRLQENGFPQRKKESKHQRLQELFSQPGIKRIDPLEVFRWTVVSTPQHSLTRWQEKAGIGGIEPSISVKETLLNELETWAKNTFGSLDQPIESEEAYILEGFWLYPQE
ncbi:Methyltransferase type 11 [Rippkaea orientalis PCC 8801]|uniref:Methyltransferase type 11 n=1 Tax=Rippkaea orientalis (strain PCC 8801 / RF-1) TaxID=41431 RepID=B7K3C7_RIPO1|nr:class I SAM-dependent methyltransferase [Rippkaea orientalis]ACK64447.1 Methyltransferase type 11 [Rippkaea orientalis PCC 8801]